jgi:hypothetical protein
MVSRDEVARYRQHLVAHGDLTVRDAICARIGHTWVHLSDSDAGEKCCACCLRIVESVQGEPAPEHR